MQRRCSPPSIGLGHSPTPVERVNGCHTAHALLLEPKTKKKKRAQSTGQKPAKASIDTHMITCRQLAASQPWRASLCRTGLFPSHNKLARRRRSAASFTRASMPDPVPSSSPTAATSIACQGEAPRTRHTYTDEENLRDARRFADEVLGTKLGPHEEDALKWALSGQNTLLEWPRGFGEATCLAVCSILSSLSIVKSINC